MYYKVPSTESVVKSRRTDILGGDIVLKPVEMRGRCFRPAELFKFLVAFSAGFSFHFLLELSSKPSRCPSCAVCAPVTESNDLLKPELQLQLREQYKAKDMHDVIRYDYFNSSLLFASTGYDDRPSVELTGHQKSDFKDILHQTMALLNSGNHQSWKLKKLINGYRRYDPLRGEEFVFDVEMSTDDPSGGSNQIEEVRRMEIVKPFGVAQLIKDHVVTNDKMIHFILPVSSSVSDRFQDFLHYFEDICLQTLEHVYLMVILFMGKSDHDRNKAEEMKAAALELSRHYRKAHIRVIQTNKEYSRAMGIDLGSKQLPPDSLLFFCDTDVTITPDFLTRCRHNAVQGKQVYYPMVFSQYNPDIVKNYSPEGMVHSLREINKYTGHWVRFGYGLMCVYNSDYRSVGGYDMDAKSWGGEDADLYIRHVKSHLKIFRAMDPALIHRYHRKSCDPRLPTRQLNMCINSLAEGYGAKSQLAKKLLMR